jgi:hypothetical protein
MRIIYLEVSSRGLDTPIRFPSPCLPCLKNAPDIRIATEENDEDTNVAKINDVKSNIKIPRLV